MTDQPIKAPIISEYKVHRKQSSVRPSLHKEPNQCRLELKERLEQFPLEFRTLFFTLLFPEHKCCVCQGMSDNSTHFKMGPLIESLTDGVAECWIHFPRQWACSFLPLRPMDPCLIWWVAFHHTEHNQARPPAQVSTYPRQMIAGAELHLSSGPT